MRIKGDNDLVFEVPDAVATSMIDAGHVHEVTSHAADDPDAAGADTPTGDGDGEHNDDPGATGDGDKPKKRRGNGD